MEIRRRASYGSNVWNPEPWISGNFTKWNHFSYVLWTCLITVFIGYAVLLINGTIFFGHLKALLTERSNCIFFRKCALLCAFWTSCISLEIAVSSVIGIAILKLKQNNIIYLDQPDSRGFNFSFQMQKRKPLALNIS